jgi:hypothetical protein
MSRSYYIQMMKQKDERITELEKERDQILKSALDSESNYCELKDSLPAHNLEQQAKALSDAHKVIVENKMLRSARDYIDFRASELLEMSKALKAGN